MKRFTTAEESIALLVKLPKDTPVFICGAKGRYYEFSGGKIVCLDCEEPEEGREQNQDPACQSEAAAGDAVQPYALGPVSGEGWPQWVALDNSTYDAWTEGFSRKRQAVRWLRSEFEVGDKANHWTRISTAGELIAAAGKQDVELDAEASDMILGYLEGHDYCLMADGEGATVRHDEQYGDSHRGDEPYTVEEAIEFCQEMNEDLLREASSPNERDEEYLAHLRKDEQLLDALMARLRQRPAFIGAG